MSLTPRIEEQLAGVAQCLANALNPANKLSSRIGWAYQADGELDALGSEGLPTPVLEEAREALGQVLSWLERQVDQLEARDAAA